MKFFIYCLLFLGLFFQTSSIFSSDRQRVAVLDFLAKGEAEKDFAIVLSENFTIALINAGKFIVVERNQLNNALKELNFQNTEDFDEKTAVEIGKLTAAQVVVIGSVTKIEDYYYICVRGVEVSTGIAKFGAKDRANSKKGLVELIDGLALSLNKEVNIKADNEDLSSDDEEEILETEDNFQSNNDYDYVARKKTSFKIKSLNIYPKDRTAANLILKAELSDIEISRISVIFEDKKEFNIASNFNIA
nr:CsgG/HfaB family protein [Spirochaetota bacterium]